jgi:hypothetical protein
MRYRSNAIENFLKEVEADLQYNVGSDQPIKPQEGQTSIGNSIQPAQCEPPKGFTFSELKKNARYIMLMTAANLSSMYNSQGRNFIIQSANFLDFYLGSNELVGQFKTKFVDSESDTVFESTSFVAWNGSTMRIY